MLASGSSMELTYNALLRKPKEVHFATIIAVSMLLIIYINHFAEVIFLYGVRLLIQELNAHSYIIPGLGDAGDLAFGEKL